MGDEAERYYEEQRERAAYEDHVAAKNAEDWRALVAERDDLQARLLVMTRERDEARARDGSWVEVPEDGVPQDKWLRIGPAAARLLVAKAARAEAAEARLAEVTPERDELRVAVDLDGRNLLAMARMRNQAHEHLDRTREALGLSLFVDGFGHAEVPTKVAELVAQREELAAALEHLRDVTGDLAEAARNACSAAQHPPLTDALFEVGLAHALPTSEAATTARRGWEAKGLELAAQVASDDAEKRRTAGDGFDGYTSSSSIDKATALYALASTLRDMAQKRQGGG